MDCSNPTNKFFGFLQLLITIETLLVYNLLKH